MEEIIVGRSNGRDSSRIDFLFFPELETSSAVSRAVTSESHALARLLPVTIVLSETTEESTSTPNHHLQTPSLPRLGIRDDVKPSSSISQEAMNCCRGDQCNDDDDSSLEIGDVG